jgi:mannosylglycerate hydrolase
MSSKHATRQVDVVVHTHWDREWYMTRETTLARAAAVMAEVVAALEDGRLQSFLFDGQTAAFADLMAGCEPPLALRLVAQVRKGKLVLGPWYVMADEFLVSGESLLRNLEFGLQDAARFAGPSVAAEDAAQGIGYLPDSFGHVAQMPQLLRQFNIHHAVLWRGADALNSLFEWQAPNGSVVPTVFLPEGYYLHPFNGPDWREQLPPLLEKLAARTPQGPLLLMQGGDHLAPNPALAARINDFNRSQSQWQLVQTTLATHVEAAQMSSAPRQRVRGELRHNAQAFVLPDVLSTRRYLKLAHQTLEDRLLAETEPLLARAWPADQPLPSATLERAWRLLIEQQAHDSICGCSVDEVHAEMQQRFVQLGQQLDALRQATLAAAGAITLHRHGSKGIDVWADDTRFSLFNCLPLERVGWQVLSLFLNGDAPKALRLHDSDGVELPCELLCTRPHAELISPLDDFPEKMSGHKVEVAIQSTVPALAARGLVVSRVDDAPGSVSIAELNNACWHVVVNASGQLLITDKRRAPHEALPLCLVSELDAGDSYNFSPPPQPHVSNAGPWRVLSGRRGTHTQELVLAVEMELPAGLSDDRSSRSASSVRNHGSLRLRLWGDEPTLHAQLTWHHQARDQRTRLLLAWPQGDAAFSDTAFDWGERQLPIAQIPAEPSRREMPVVVQPSHSAISAGPWQMAHRAMQEFERVAHKGQHWLGVTMVRSVGWLSRRDLRTRGVGAGPDLATPGAQCLGTHVFDFLLHAHVADAPAHEALQAAATLRRPLLALRGHLPLTAGPSVDIGNPTVQTSAVRRLADGAIEMRVWNPTDQAQALSLNGAQWQAVFADGRPNSNNSSSNSNSNSSTLRLAPRSMLSLRSRVDSPA